MTEWNPQMKESYLLKLLTMGAAVRRADQDIPMFEDL